MVRDIRMDADYFTKYIADADVQFNNFLSLAQKKESVGNDSAAKKAYTFAAGQLRNKMIALYSVGAELSEINNAFEKLIEIYRKFSNLSYSDLLLVVSFCVLIKPKEEITFQVNQLLGNFKDKDLLIEGFENYLLGKGFVYSNESIKYSNYSKLEKVVKADGKATQLSKLIRYISEDWYTSQSDTAWYNSHIENRETYFGYWCFECLALAVALSLDLSDLKNIKYVPKDLL